MCKCGKASYGIVEMQGQREISGTLKWLKNY